MIFAGSLDNKSIHDFHPQQKLSTWKYQLSYDHSSQAASNSVSSYMGDGSSFAWVLLLTLKVG